MISISILLFDIIMMFLKKHNVRSIFIMGFFVILLSSIPGGGGGYSSISLTGMLVREQISTTQKKE